VEEPVACLQGLPRHWPIFFGGEKTQFTHHAALTSENAAGRNQLLICWIIAVRYCCMPGLKTPVGTGSLSLHTDECLNLVDCHHTVNVLVMYW